MLPVIISVVVALVLLLVFSIPALYHKCPPNKVLVFFGMSGGKGYRTIRGGASFRKPLVEKVASMDLTNMIIELSAHNAYAKGGVPVHVLAVANVKISSEAALLDNAIERFLGKTRSEIMAVAKATLEGSLRGVLATLTPEQLNEDRDMFEERLAQEADHDMNALGLTVDNVKIQNITDDVRYLDSIGRIRNAVLISSARVAEAVARADSAVREAENNEREVEAQVTAQIEVAKADAARALADIRTRRTALVAEEEAAVAALVAQAEADVEVQKARIEQVRKKLEADVIAPAHARMEAMQQEAAATVAPIIEEGKARADALTRLSESWTAAGDQAREIFLIQKIEPIIESLTETIAETRIEKVTVIDQGDGGGSGTNPARLLNIAEQVKEVFGIDIVEKLQNVGEKPKADPIPDPKPGYSDDLYEDGPPPQVN